jgi:foldase protein PrsA
MRKSALHFPFSTLLTLALLTGSVARADDAVTGDALIARGNGVHVRRSQLEEAWAIYQTKFQRGAPPDEPRQNVETKLLHHIIETELLMARATTEEKARAQEETDIGFANSRKRFGTEDDFRKWLKTTAMTPDVYRRRMLEQRISEVVIDRDLQPLANVSDDDVKNYYEQNVRAFDKPEQVRGLQIFFSTVDPATRKPLPDEQKKAKEEAARKVKARLDEGEDFLKLYREFSEESGARQQEEGKEMLYPKGQIGPEFDAVAFTLKAHSISEVVASSRGYHIIRVSAHEPAARPAYPEVAPRLRKFLVDLEIKKQLPGYLEKLRKEAGVEIL